MKQSENESGSFGVRLKSEPDFKSVKIVKSFIYHGKSNDGINKVCTDFDVCINAKYKGGRVAHGKKSHINPYIF